MPAVWHYRDSDHLEADAVVEAGDDRWMAVEVKLGSDQGIDDAAKSLLRLADKIDTERVGRIVPCAVTPHQLRWP